MSSLKLPAYAAPAVPLAFLGLPLYVYLPAHYAALPQIGLAAVGGVLLLARLLDLLTDPLVGLLSDRLRHRLRPQWMMTGGALLMVGGAAWLFRPPADAGALYLFFSLSITYLGWTLLAIPYHALGAEIGEHAGQARVAAWREAGIIIGTLGALLLPAMVTGHDALSLSAEALQWLAPPALLLCWLLRTGPGAHRAGADGPVSIWRHTGRPVRELLGIHLLNVLAGGTAATLFLIFTRDVIGLDQRASGLLLLAYLGAGLVTLPAWVWLAGRIGLARAWRSAMLLAALGFAPAAFLGQGDVAAFLLVCLVTGATLGADIAMPAAIQARLVVEESRRHARPRGGALFGLWGMAGKLALALAAGLALPLLALLAGDATALTRADVTPWLYAGLPVLIKLTAVAALQRSTLLGGAPGGLPPETREDFDETAARVDPGHPVDFSGRL